MKKSTILLLVVVYILSFLVIGLLGHSIRNYDPVIEPTAVKVVDVDKKMEKVDASGYDYYFIYRNYTQKEFDNKVGIRIQAVVEPANSSYQEVDFFKDEHATSFTLDTHKKNPDTVEFNFAVVTLTAMPSTIVRVNNVPSYAVLSTNFTISTTNPGANQIVLKIGITFVGPLPPDE